MSSNVEEEQGLRKVAVDLIENLIRVHVPLFSHCCSVRSSRFENYLLGNFKLGIVRDSIRDIGKYLRNPTGKNLTKPRPKPCDIRSVSRLILDELVEGVQKVANISEEEAVLHIIICDLNEEVRNQWVKGVNAPLQHSVLLKANVLEDLIAIVRGKWIAVAGDNIRYRRLKCCKLMGKWLKEDNATAKVKIEELDRLREDLKQKQEEVQMKMKILKNYLEEDIVYKGSDLTDEAGTSHVRLCNVQAGELQDREMDRWAQISAMIDKNKEKSKAESEADNDGQLVTESNIQHIISSRTGIPVEEVSTDKSDHLLKMEETLYTRVTGQQEVIKAITCAIGHESVGENPHRPVASFIFSGPTGVGKLDFAKSLATYYFGSEEAMIHLDMSKFKESHTVSKLIGSPPGDVGYTEGGQLTEAVRAHPYTFLLFDYIEEAHPNVLNLILQILEDGRLTDGQGRTVDFSKTLVLMTWKVTEKGGHRIGFDLDHDESVSRYNRDKSWVTQELKQYFRPEFLNRLDELSIFRQLKKLEVKEIADILLKEVFERLKNKEVELHVTERFRDRVVAEGYNPSHGVCPSRTAIIRLLEDYMAQKMLAREIKKGDSVIVDVDYGDNLIVSMGAPPDPEAPP